MHHCQWTAYQFLPQNPKIFFSKNNSNNYNNIQSSVQSFKPKINNSNNNQLEIYDSSQDFPLGGRRVYNSSSVNNSSQINNNNINAQSSTKSNNSIDFNSIVKIIASLSESVIKWSIRFKHLKII